MTSAAEKLSALRRALAEAGAHGFVVPHDDEFHNEYLPPSAERLAWLTGFTGSAGTALVLTDKAALFVDGRYTLQAPLEVDTAFYSVVPQATTNLLDWALLHTAAGQSLAYDPWLHPQSWVEQASKKLAEKSIRLVPLAHNPIDTLWTDRPAPPQGAFVPHPDAFAGESAQAKRMVLAEQLKKDGVDAFVINAPDSLAWLLNIRGADVPHTPLPLAFALLHSDGTVDLFAAESRMTPALRAHLGNAVRVHNPAQFGPTLQALATTRKVAADAHSAAAWIFATASAPLRRLADPCVLLKARKNAVEQEGTRRAHARDGAAVAQTLHWIVSTPPGTLDELQVMATLRAARAKGEHFADLSFETIAGSGPNGAIVHYRSTEKTNRKLQAGELFLLDSGAQYKDGTTDITRTVAIGTPSDEMRDRYTRVLKGHIAIATAVFPEGTTGHQLDALARIALWQVGLDYDHGTGHGVGSYLSVHEGPQRISKVALAQALEPGMIISNEPGYYKAGAYGIRIENLVMVQRRTIAGAEKPMLGFETLTLCPYDCALIKPELLTAEERTWLNAYHARVAAVVGPQLENAAGDWLNSLCAPI